MRQRPLAQVVSVGVLAAIIVATVIAVIAAGAYERGQHRQEESRLATESTEALAEELTLTTARLNSVRRLFESIGPVSPAGFSAFAQPLVERNEALLAIGWNPRVTPAERTAFERTTGRPIVISGTDRPAPRGRDHFPELLISAESTERHPGSFARHLADDPGLAQARSRVFRLAAQGGTARVSAPVELRDGAPGFIIATPVYEAAAGGPNLRGYIVGVYRSFEFGAQALVDHESAANIQVSDGTTTLLSLGDPISSDATTAVIEASGRTWIVGVSRPGSPDFAFPVLVALGGLLLAALVATTLVGAQRRETHAVAGRASAEGRVVSMLARHESILAAASEGIIGVDGEGRATFVNPAAADLLQRPAEDLLGGQVASFFGRESSSPAAADDEDFDPVAAAIRTGTLQRDESLAIRRSEGDTVPVEHTTAPLVEGAKTVGAVVSFRDVTVRRQLEEQTRRSLDDAERRAAVDPLTGLANHRTFHERLSAETERARRHGRVLSLVVMDLDHFKLVNDTHGHQEGDRVLAAIAKVMESQSRAGELLARVGGEEFALILPESDEMDAYQAAERIRNAVASSDFPPYGRITLSAGVCGLDQAGDADRLYQLADGALYWAKNRGRDVVFRYSPEVVQALSAEERANRLQREQALMSIRILARAVDAKDPTTRRHSERVAALSAEIAARLGWPEDRLELLREAGLVHDVGKIGVPDAILFKPDRLTSAEYRDVQQHAALSAQIVAEALSPEQISWVRGHHERWDGSGYPDARAGFDIPEGARIMALADAWDTMLSERPYKPPSSAEEAIAECERFAGTQFWPAGVEALIATVKAAV